MRMRRRRLFTNIVADDDLVTVLFIALIGLDFSLWLLPKGFFDFALSIM